MPFNSLNELRVDLTAIKAGTGAEHPPQSRLKQKDEQRQEK